MRGCAGDFGRPPRALMPPAVPEQEPFGVLARRAYLSCTNRGAKKMRQYLARVAVIFLLECALLIGLVVAIGSGWL